MKKIFASALFIISGFFLKAQIISSNRWTDLFSYNNVLSIHQGNDKMIAATENGIFFYTPSTGELTKLSKANGLHEVKITAFDYNPDTKIGLVGYKNGKMDVITPEGVTLVMDIPIATGFTGDKRINHIYIEGNRAVVSVAYGVSIFNLDRKEFGDTAFFNNGATFTSAKESIIKNNKIYSATPTGLYSHEIDTTFPVFSTWNMVKNGNFNQLATNGDKIVVADEWYSYIGDGTSFNSFTSFPNPITDVVMKNTSNVVFSTLNGMVYEYSPVANLVRSKDFGEGLNTCYISGNAYFGGSKHSGILNEAGNQIKPDGPYSNISYKLDLYQNQIVVSTGGRDAYNGALMNNVGYYHFDGTKWNYPEIFKTKTSYNILDAVINPNKPTEVFFTSFMTDATHPDRGIFKVENGQITKQYGATDSDRVVGLTYDENKQLFVSTSYIPMSAGPGTGYRLYNASGDSFSLNPVVASARAQKPLTKDGILYIPAPWYTGGGMLIYDYNNTPTNTNDDSFKILRRENGLPSDGTISCAVDKNDNLWIGTFVGIRVLSNPKAAISDSNPQANPIIIEQNGIGEELFRDGQILQISVDSGNQKWVSLDGGGVYYLSADGEQTYQHFTSQNSPLPNDVVTDIKIDDASGKIYFATYDGIVVYQGDVVNTTNNFGDVLVYPNPVVWANYKGNVRIRGLAQKTNIRITDAAGNLVHSAVAKGGFYEWNLNNQRGVRVASGIYYVLMTNEDGTDKATAKIAVVN